MCLPPVDSERKVNNNNDDYHKHVGYSTIAAGISSVARGVEWWWEKTGVDIFVRSFGGFHAAACCRW